MYDEKTILKQLSQKMLSKGYGTKTQHLYINTVKAYLKFHQGRDPKDMGMKEIESFMNDLSKKMALHFKKREQSFQALLFLYIHVLNLSLREEYIEASRSIKSATTKKESKKYVQSVMVF
jgi:hypothetical protein